MVNGTGIGAASQLQKLQPLAKGLVGSSGSPDGAGETSFDDVLEDALSQVNRLFYRADRLTQDLALGKDVELHDVTIATEQAQLALQFTIAVRNKLVEAYKEVMRMRI